MPSIALGGVFVSKRRSASPMHVSGSFLSVVTKSFNTYSLPGTIVFFAIEKYALSNQFVVSGFFNVAASSGCASTSDHRKYTSPFTLAPLP
eukprot:31559-Pelagococcus_subviridis.AAC.5